MNAIHPYLIFNGNCREAVTYYADALGGSLDIMGADQMPVQPGQPAPDPKLVLHAKITVNGKVVLMASDSMMNSQVAFGSNISLSIDSAGEDEQTKMFDKLSDGGTVKMALQHTFWGARFGMLIDRFGVHWMLNYELPK